MATTTLLSTVAGSTSNAATYAAASGTPGTGKLIVVLALVTGTGSTGTCTDNRSGTYTLIRTEHKGSGADCLYLFVRDALTSSASSHTVTVDVTGDNGTGAVVGCWYIDGMSQAGSAAVRQTQGASSQTSGTTPTLTFASSCLTGNTLLGCLVNATNPAGITAPTGWAAEDWDVGYASPTAGSWGGHRDGGFTGTSVTIGNSASQWGAIIVELDTSSSTASITVNQASDTDSAQALTESKAVAAGQASDTDTAQSLTGAKTVAAGQVSDTDTAHAVTESKAATVGQASGTDTVFGVDGAKAASAGLASDTDSAHPLVPTKSIVLGLASDTDSVHAVSFSVGVDLGSTSDSDSAHSVSAGKGLAAGQASESDSVHAVSVSRAAKLVGLASDSDSTFSVTRSKQITLGLASDVDEAFAVTSAIVAESSLGLASDTDSVFPMPAASKLIVLGLAVEGDFLRRLSQPARGASPIPPTGERRVPPLSVFHPVSGPLSRR